MTLIGNPSAAAEPVTAALLDSYNAWLHFERRYLRFERYGMGDGRDYVSVNNPGGLFHGSPWPPAPQPSSRAAVVLAAVGRDLREDGR